MPQTIKAMVTIPVEFSFDDSNPNSESARHPLTSKQQAALLAAHEVLADNKLGWLTNNTTITLPETPKSSVYTLEETHYGVSYALGSGRMAYKSETHHMVFSSWELLNGYIIQLVEAMNSNKVGGREFHLVSHGPNNGDVQHKVISPVDYNKYQEEFDSSSPSISLHIMKLGVDLFA